MTGGRGAARRGPTAFTPRGTGGSDGRTRGGAGACGAERRAWLGAQSPGLGPEASQLWGSQRGKLTEPPSCLRLTELGSTSLTTGEVHSNATPRQAPARDHLAATAQKRNLTHTPEFLALPTTTWFGSPHRRPQTLGEEPPSTSPCVKTLAARSGGVAATEPPSLPPGS